MTRRGEPATRSVGRLTTIEILNGLPAAEFVVAIAPLFQGAPRFLERLADARPFSSFADVWPRALAIARAMPEADELELINAHPRLGAPPASVSALSFREQGYDQDHHQDGTEGEAARVAAELEQLNAAYEARFGFRFCVFVNGRSRAALVPVIEATLEADRAVEIRRALGEVVAIAADRSRKLLT